MGTVLGVSFITAAAAIGIGVGMRPTVIDGRRISAELQKAVADQGISVECDREIRVGVRGAEFVCTLSRGAVRERIEYTMTREGKYAPRNQAPGDPPAEPGEGAGAGAGAGGD
jgi:hypothetical protein